LLEAKAESRPHEKKQEQLDGLMATTPRHRGIKDEAELVDCMVNLFVQAVTLRAGAAFKQKMGRVTDGHKLAQRQKQIDFGKATAGYREYLRQVPKGKRMRHHPRTPDITADVSKRKFHGRVRQWRRALHAWDPQPSHPSHPSQKHEQRKVPRPVQRVIVSEFEQEMYEGDDALVCSQEIDRDGCVRTDADAQQNCSPQFSGADNASSVQLPAVQPLDDTDDDNDEEEPVLFGSSDANACDAGAAYMRSGKGGEAAHSEGKQRGRDAFDGGEVMLDRLPAHSFEDDASFLE